MANVYSNSAMDVSPHMGLNVYGRIVYMGQNV